MGKKLLERAILSVVNQTQNPFEYIIIDDGSTDSSFQIAESYSKNTTGFQYIKIFRILEFLKPQEKSQTWLKGTSCTA